MEITFKYKDKVITTPNLEKKLKRMKISIDDREILTNPIKKEEIQKEECEFKGIKEWKYYKHPNSDIIHCCLIDINTNPNKKDLFKFTENYINELNEVKLTSK